MSKLIPLNSYCVIEPVMAEKLTKGGLHIPDTAEKEKPQIGKVIAVSETNIATNGESLPIEIKVGQTVLFGRYAGECVDFEGKEYKIVEQQYVRAIIQ